MAFNKAFVAGLLKYLGTMDRRFKMFHKQPFEWMNQNFF